MPDLQDPQPAVRAPSEALERFRARAAPVHQARLQGKKRQALEGYRELLRDFQDAPETFPYARLALGQTLLEMGQPEAALEQFRVILDTLPPNGDPWPWFYAKLNSIDARRQHGGDHAQSLLAYNELLAEFGGLASDNLADLFVGLGETCFALGRLDEAAAHFRTARDRHPSPANTWTIFNARAGLLRVLKEQGRMMEVRRDYQRLRADYRDAPDKLRAVPVDTGVRLDWCIHWSCNYRCSYCFFNKTWTDLANRNVYKSVDEWMSVWRRMRDLYGRIYLVINGGEPFTYPGFVELIYQVQQLHGPINICTNVSQADAVEDLMRRAKANWTNHISITLSFHPQFETVDGFLDKVRRLRDVGTDIGALNMVAWPPFLKALPSHVEKFFARGESVRIHPFIGVHKGVKYPDGYTSSERALMNLPDTWVESKRPKGRVCAAGQMAGLIAPDGTVTRCGQPEWGGRPFGNVFDPDFRLMDEPIPCHAESCPCDKWKIIREEQRPKSPAIWFM